MAWPANYKALLSEGEGFGSLSKGARICLPGCFFFFFVKARRPIAS